jgi:hypothetical protein
MFSERLAVERSAVYATGPFPIDKRAVDLAAIDKILVDLAEFDAPLVDRNGAPSLDDRARNTRRDSARSPT